MLSDTEFLSRFDAGTLEVGAVDHEAHIRLAWLCLREAPFPDALARLRRGLKRLTIAAGRPQRYHETITVAYARLVERQMREVGDVSWPEFCAHAPDLLAPGLGALHAIYRRGVLDTAEARTTFVPPDAWDAPTLDPDLQAYVGFQQTLDARPPSALEATADDETSETEAPTAEPVSVTAVLAVADVETSARWYTDVFGFDVAPFPERPPYRFALLSRAGAELMLRAAADPASIRPPEGWALYVRLAGGRIRDLHATLAERGEVLRPLQRMPHGDAEFDVRDPDGYVVVVAEWEG